MGLPERRRPAGVGSQRITGVEQQRIRSSDFAAPLPDAPTPEIRIELQRGATTVKVNWPANAAGECAAWLRELLR